MLRQLVLILIVALLLPISLHASDSGSSLTRCGWLDNPTPNNFSFTDRDGEWMISMQGMGMDGGTLTPAERDRIDVALKNLPTFPKGQWKQEGNGNYGYGCMCARMTVDTEAKWVLTLADAKAKPLAACLKDPHLPQENR